MSDDIKDNPWGLTEAEREELLRNAPARGVYDDDSIVRVIKVVEELKKATEEFNQEWKAWLARTEPTSQLDLWKEFENSMRREFP